MYALMLTGIAIESGQWLLGSGEGGLTQQMRKNFDLP